MNGIRNISNYTTDQKTLIITFNLQKAFKNFCDKERKLKKKEKEKERSHIPLSFKSFLRYGELSDLKRSEIVLHKTHLSIFIGKSKTDV